MLWVCELPEEGPYDGHDDPTCTTTTTAVVCAYVRMTRGYATLTLLLALPRGSVGFASPPALSCRRRTAPHMAARHLVLSATNRLSILRPAAATGAGPTYAAAARQSLRLLRLRRRRRSSRLVVPVSTSESMEAGATSTQGAFLLVSTSLK